MSLLDKEPVKRVEKLLKEFDQTQKVIVLDNSARTAHEAASRAVLAEVLKTITFWLGSNCFNKLSTRLTGSLSNKLIIQL